MPTTWHPTRWPARVALILAPLALAGCGGEAPPSRVTTDPAPSPYTNATRDGGTAEQTAPIAPPEPSATRDRAALDQAAAAVDDQVRQASAEIGQQADDLKSGVTRAVGNAQVQAEQAADGVKGVATEVRSAVDGARANARKQARDVGTEVRKSAEDLKANLLDDLLGPDPKATPR